MDHSPDTFSLSPDHILTVCRLSEKVKRKLEERLFRDDQAGWSRVYEIQQMEIRAGKGDADALKKMGDMYFEGVDYPSDLTKAIDYYEQAVRKGSMEAAVCLGRLYQNGSAGYVDDSAAVRLFRQAALMKCIPAYIALGDTYLMGWGVNKEASTAASWYRKAAAEGSPEADQRLSELNNSSVHKGVLGELILCREENLITLMRKPQSKGKETRR